VMGMQFKSHQLHVIFCYDCLQTKATGRELFVMVCKHLKLSAEVDYFCLSYLDDNKVRVSECELANVDRFPNIC